MHPFVAGLEAARRVLVLERAGVRFRRRRQAWLDATDHEPSFDARTQHPTWRLMTEANALILRISGGLD